MKNVIFGILFVVFTILFVAVIRYEKEEQPKPIITTITTIDRKDIQDRLEKATPLTHKGRLDYYQTILLECQQMRGEEDIKIEEYQNILFIESMTIRYLSDELLNWKYESGEMEYR